MTFSLDDKYTFLRNTLVSYFRGEKFSREQIFAGIYFRECHSEKFRGNLFSRISRMVSFLKISREFRYNIVVFRGGLIFVNFAKKLLSGHFAGTNFREFLE